METNFNNMSEPDKSFEAYVPQGLEIVKGMRVTLGTLQPSVFQRRLSVSHEMAVSLLEYLVQNEDWERDT